MNETDQAITSSIRRHLWGGGLFLCSLLAFMTGWAAWMEISGAIIAPGAIMVETNVKTIKHKEGGIIGRILIKNGDLVSSGDLLIRLDDAVTQANLAAVYKQIDELTATEARLVAERDGLDEIAFPATLTDRIKDPAIARIVTDQKQWKMARTSAFSGRIDQLTEQVNQLESQIVSLNIQSTAKADEIALVSQELDSLEILSRKKYVANNRVLAVRREKARLTGEHGALLQEATRTGLAISERKIQVFQLREDNLADILQQLNTTRSELAQLEEQKLVAEDQLSPHEHSCTTRRLCAPAQRAHQGWLHRLGRAGHADRTKGRFSGHRNPGRPDRCGPDLFRPAGHRSPARPEPAYHART